MNTIKSINRWPVEIKSVHFFIFKSFYKKLISLTGGKSKAPPVVEISKPSQSDDSFEFPKPLPVDPSGKSNGKTFFKIVVI